MIRFQSVSKHYRQVAALSGVSFDICEGDIFGYIGPNGAGKTTTIKILTGLIRDFEGKVTVYGSNVQTRDGSHKRLIGYLPQDAGFQEWRTVNHVLYTFARLSGLGKSECDRKILQVLKKVGILEHRDRKVVHLSGGTVQKLRFAQAILHDPKILVLDEPLSGLDPSSRYHMKELIREFAEGNRMVFLSSHILNDVEDVANRIGILHAGRMRKIGTPNELRTEFDLGNILEIELSEQTDLPKEISTLEYIQAVSSIGTKTHRLEIDRGTDLDRAVHGILEQLLSSRIHIRGFQCVRPSLEDAYLSYTEEH